MNHGFGPIHNILQTGFLVESCDLFTDCCDLFPIYRDTPGDRPVGYQWCVPMLGIYDTAGVAPLAEFAHN